MNLTVLIENLVFSGVLSCQIVFTFKLTFNLTQKTLHSESVYDDLKCALLTFYCLPVCSSEIDVIEKIMQKNRRQMRHSLAGYQATWNSSSAFSRA